MSAKVTYLDHEDGSREVSKNTPKERVTPFVLQLSVHGGKDLAIADYTTSDPYVVVSLGDKVIGKTQVKYFSNDIF